MQHDVTYCSSKGYRLCDAEGTEFFAFVFGEIYIVLVSLETFYVY